MESVKQRCRSKHATLILKCYPRYTKHATTVQPNSSELHYLLYYASTRRSKLQKVGTFLQTKTAHDVYKNKLSNVQVTLQITNALIHALPKDLPLYATYILNILTSILRSQDLTMVEESIPAFEAFCQHQDITTLAASQTHLDQFEQVVRIYASYAALKTPIQTKGGFNTPTAIRWRIAGLKALRSVTASEAIGADGGRQMNIVMPVVLQNLHSGDPDHLTRVQQQAQSEEGTDRPARENARRRRMSVATARTSEKLSRPSSSAVDGAAESTVDDADQIAEEEVELLALQCLKQVFTVHNRIQIRLAMDAMLNFIWNEPPSLRPTTSRSGRSGLGATWSTTLVESAAQWTPVQDRFVILTTLMEVLAKIPMKQERIDEHLQLFSLVDWLLRSNINMIGLSVMDVLLGLIHHMRSLIQLLYQTGELPPQQQTEPIELSKDAQTILDRPGSPASTETSVAEDATPSNGQALLVKVRRCIAALAMHVYYTDQISDIANTILARIRPLVKLESGESNESDDIEESLTSGTAKSTALNAIKEALIVANTKGSVTGGAAIGRSRVSMDAWQNTKWLLLDPDPRVRRAYIDTLLVWCRLEKSQQDAVTLREAHPEQSSLAELPHPRQSGFLPNKYPEIYHLALDLRRSDTELILLESLIYHLESASTSPSAYPPKATENGTAPAITLNKSRLLHPDANLIENHRPSSLQTSTSYSPSRTPPHGPKPAVRFERLRQIMHQERGASPDRNTIGSNTQSIDFSYGSRPSSTVSRKDGRSQTQPQAHSIRGEEGSSKQSNGERPLSEAQTDLGSQSEEITISHRPSTSSSREDPEINAAALRGARLSVEMAGEIPPVPPLPKELQQNPRGFGPKGQAEDLREGRDAPEEEEPAVDVDRLLRGIVVAEHEEIDRTEDDTRANAAEGDNEHAEPFGGFATLARWDRAPGSRRAATTSRVLY